METHDQPPRRGMRNGMRVLQTIQQMGTCAVLHLPRDPSHGVFVSAPVPGGVEQRQVDRGEALAALHMLSWVGADQHGIRYGHPDRYRTGAGR